MQNETGNSEKRLMSLEEKVEFQEYTIEKLNDVICTQQRQIDQLEERVHRLLDKLPPGRFDMEESSRKDKPLQY